MTDTIQSNSDGRASGRSQTVHRSNFSIQGVSAAALAGPGTIRLPLVSFIVTSADAANFRAAVEAIGAQDYPHVEAIVVGPALDLTGITPEEGAIASTPRVRHLRCGDEDGRFAKEMAGLHAAEGEFITFLDAADLPSPHFASAHIQTHLASRHNVAFTASSRRTNTLERQSDGSDTSTEGCLRPAEANLRLACIDQAMFAQLAANTLLYPPAPQSPSRLTTGSAVYRRFVMNLLHPVGQVTNLSGLTADSHFVPLCHTLGGCVFINMNLMTTSEPEDDVAKRDQNGALEMEINRQRLRVWIGNGSEFARRIGSKRYWAAIAAMLPSGSDIDDNRASPTTYAALMEGQVPLLSTAFGSTSAIQRLDVLMPRAALIALLREQYGPRLPLRVHWALQTMPVRVHWALQTMPVRAMHERVRLYLRTRRVRRKETRRAKASTARPPQRSSRPQS